jgi:hypothetical protein
MQTLFQKMRANRGRWIKPPIQADEVQPAPGVPFMVVDGERYVEARERVGCQGCAFYGTENGSCTQAWRTGETEFGGSCSQRNVIYIKVE